MFYFHYRTWSSQIFHNMKKTALILTSEYIESNGRVRVEAHIQELAAELGCAGSLGDGAE